MASVKIRQEIVDRLRELELANDGLLTPEAVVEDARDPDSPLHGGFEWDVEAAAYQHHLDCARRLIRSVKLMVKTETRTYEVRSYWKNPESDSKEQGYISFQRIASDEELKRSLLVEEYRKIARKLTTLRDTAEALDAAEVHDELVVTLGIAIQHVESRA